MLKSQLVEKNNQIEAKSKALEALFTSAKNDKGEYDATKAGMTAVVFAEKVRAANDELTALGKERDSIAAGVQAEADQKRRQDAAGQKTAFAHPDGGTPEQKTEAKSLGQMFIASKAYTDRVADGLGPKAHLDIELKTLMSRTAGFAPESLRTGRVVDAATRPLQVIDILPMVTTSYDHVKYMEETTFTNNAAEKAEGVAYAESALAYTERSKPVEKITVFIPVTDEQLEDVAFIEGRIDTKLRFMLNQRLDYQVLNGDGSTPNLQGLLNLPSIQTQARGTDPGPDAIRKAMTKVRIVGRAVPNAVIMNPYDWDNIRLLRTTDGIYIWGAPSEAGPERIWGTAVAQSDALSQHTALTGDFANFAYIASKRGIDVQVGYINDDFKLGRRSVRADLRTVIVWERAAGFCSVTSL